MARIRDELGKWREVIDKSASSRSDDSAAGATCDYFWPSTAAVRATTSFGV